MEPSIEAYVASMRFCSAIRVRKWVQRSLRDTVHLIRSAPPFPRVVQARIHEHRLTFFFGSA